MGLKDVMQVILSPYQYVAHSRHRAHVPFDQACEAFKRAVKKKDTATALEKMEEMKEAVLTFESLKPLGSNSSEAIERQLTRDFYEYAVLFAIDCEDGLMFARFVASLQPFYRVNRFVHFYSYFICLTMNWIFG